MDVVLVGTDLVGPGPFVEVSGGGKLVEAAVPENGACVLLVCREKALVKSRLTCGDGADERFQDCDFAQHLGHCESRSVCFLILTIGVLSS